MLILVFLSFAYFILLYKYSSEVSKNIKEVLEVFGKFIYFLPLILLLKRKSNVNLRNQLFTPKLKHLIIAIFSSGILFFIYFLLAYPEEHVSEFNISLSFFGMIVLTPIMEEVFYRGLIFHQLLKRYNMYVAMFFSSLLFALIHLNIIIVIPLFLFSLLTSYLYIKSKQSLIVTIIAHVVWNFLVEIM